VTPKPVAVIGPNTLSGFHSEGSYGEFAAPDYAAPELKGNSNATRVALWFKSWDEAQEFVSNLPKE